MSKVYVSDSKIQGSGVISAQQIARGEIVLAIDDSRIVDDPRPLKPELGENPIHRDWLGDGRVVLMQAPERYINHCCDPNTFVRTIGGIRYVFALQDIHAGEEITYDYSINSGGDTVWQCSCGAARCRKAVHSDFFHLPFDLQVEYLPLLEDWYIRAHDKQTQALITATLAKADQTE